ncbi:hypothetical protein C2G38_2180822 [Gigaspora rosea]|uniref:Uncharacterized protein n=1 Tax=Gigaspora rosea TaxID=44941 RepID=A0A397VIX8_9GLOM|nr:hypothetical protein C2G38_2180822 [Gigaspora rosea]
MFEPTNENLVREQKTVEQIRDGFIENQYNARNITLQAMIDEIGSDDIKKI